MVYHIKNRFGRSVGNMLGWVSWGEDRDGSGDRELGGRAARGLQLRQLLTAFSRTVKRLTTSGLPFSKEEDSRTE